MSSNSGRDLVPRGTRVPQGMLFALPCNSVRVEIVQLLLHIRKHAMPWAHAVVSHVCNMSNKNINSSPSRTPWFLAYFMSMSLP